KILDSFEWEGLYQLSETLLLNIDQFLKKNKIELKEIKEIKVKVGDQVIYGKYSGTEITYEGKEYLIMKESDIYAVL
ncbi:MAG: hypothetical protein KKB19_11140, partial [Bacteroidetes bacterium]|nr:hypothetical protein [Bacteroidota bacterium]